MIIQGNLCFITQVIKAGDTIIPMAEFVSGVKGHDVDTITRCLKNYRTLVTEKFSD
jgi:hypothetical protein